MPEASPHAAKDFQLELQLTKRDYLRAYRRQFWRSLGLLVLLASCLPLLSMWRAPAFRHELQTGMPAAIRVAIAAYVVVALFLAFTVELLARSYSSLVVRKTPLALEPQSLTFSSEGMQSQTRSRSGLVHWKSFQKAIATGWAFQLYSSSTQYVLLPFRQFQSPEEVRGFRQMLKQQLGKRARFSA